MKIKLDDFDNPYAQFVGLKLSEFIIKVRESYPFATISFSGGGSLIIDTGLSFRYMGDVLQRIKIETDLYADDSNYEKDGEERVALY